MNEQTIQAGLILLALAGVTIAIHRIAVSQGAVLGLSPLAAAGLVSAVAYGGPKLISGAAR